MPLTETGYNAPSIQELVDNMNSTARIEFGDLIDTSSNSVLGHLIGVNAIEQIKVYEDLQELVANIDPNSSEGRMLENICLLGGIVRQSAAFSTGVVTFTGTPSTAIPQGTVITVQGDSDRRFLTRSDQVVGSEGGVRVLVKAESPGAVSAPSGTLTQLESPIAGITDVTNEDDITLGTDTVESDSALRRRRNNTLSVGGNGSATSVRSALEQIDGVTTVKIVNNNTHLFKPRNDSNNNLRPPGSIECIIEGGDESEIVKTIALTKSATTETFGLWMASYEDQIGNRQTIRFSRPETVDLSVEVTYTKYSEEIFPEDGEAQIQSNLLSFADEEYSLGQDVLVDRLYKPVLEVQGIRSVSIRVSISGSENLQETDIQIQDFERALLSSSNVTIIQQ